mgnify:CR=1 FL=1
MVAFNQGHGDGRVDGRAEGAGSHDTDVFAITRQYHLPLTHGTTAIHAQADALPRRGLGQLPLDALGAGIAPGPAAAAGAL